MGSSFGNSTVDPTVTATTRGTKFSFRWRISARIVGAGVHGASFRYTTTWRSSDSGAKATVGTLREYVEVGRLAVTGMPIDTRPRTEARSWAAGWVPPDAMRPRTAAASMTELRAPILME